MIYISGCVRKLPPRSYNVALCPCCSAGKRLLDFLPQILNLKIHPNVPVRVVIRLAGLASRRLGGNGRPTAGNMCLNIVKTKR